MVGPVLHVPTFNNGRSVTSKVNVESGALLELIEAIYYDNISTTKVIGTLLGSRSDDGSIVTVKASYVVPLKEENDDLAFQDAYHLSTLQLYKKSNPDLNVVGWFSTDSVIDTYTGLVHDIYNKNGKDAVLLTLQYNNEAGEVISPIIRTFTSSMVGLPGASNIVQSLGIDKSGAYAFAPIPNEIISSKSELTALKFVSQAAKNDNSTLTVSNKGELVQLQESIKKSIQMITVLREYVGRVTKGEIKGQDEIKNLLVSTLKYQLSESQLERVGKSIESNINDSLVLEYLASCLKQQLDLSAKLTNFVLPEEALNL